MPAAEPGSAPWMLQDGVWEGIRLHKGVLAFGQRHLKRLFEGAKAIDMDLGELSVLLASDQRLCSQVVVQDAA